VDDAATVEDVLHQALNKYNDALKHSDREGADKYAPPSKTPHDFVLRVAKGDGTPDRGAPALETRGLLREQGLLFPYMLVLTLDPTKDISTMNLTDAYKAQLLSTAQRRISSPADTSRDAALRYGTFMEPPDDKPIDTSVAQDKWRQFSAADQQARREELERKRLENVRKLEKQQEENERRHLEDCTKKERARQGRMTEERRAEEQRQLQLLEQNHKLEMARKMDQYMREQKQRELMEQQKAALEEDERDRRRRQEALERERELRAQQKMERELQARKEKRLAWEAGRQARTQETLEYIIAKLDWSVECDNQMRKEMLERERIEREAYERELFEREYTARIERQRRAAKEAETQSRLYEQQRLAEQRQRQHDTLLAAARQREAEEEDRKREWVQERSLIKEKTAREKEATVLLQTIQAR
jgi:hypothetical protein